MVRTTLELGLLSLEEKTISPRPSALILPRPFLPLLISFSFTVHTSNLPFIFLLLTILCQYNVQRQAAYKIASARLLPSHFVKTLSHIYVICGLCVSLTYATLQSCAPSHRPFIRQHIYINQLIDRTNTSYHRHVTFWLLEKIGRCVPKHCG